MATHWFDSHKAKVMLGKAMSQCLSYQKLPVSTSARTGKEHDSRRLSKGSTQNENPTTCDTAQIITFKRPAPVKRTERQYAAGLI